MKMSMTPQKRSSSFWHGVIQCSYAAAVTGATSCLSVARSFSLGWFARWALFVIADTSITPCIKKLAIPRFETGESRFRSSFPFRPPDGSVFPPPYCHPPLAHRFPLCFLSRVFFIRCCFLSIFLFVLPPLSSFFVIALLRLFDMFKWIGSVNLVIVDSSRFLLRLGIIGGKMLGLNEQK